jgi:hypothetical protein
MSSLTIKCLMYRLLRFYGFLECDTSIKINESSSSVNGQMLFVEEVDR